MVETTNKMNRPLISVIVPVYKTPEEYLRACIESLMSQTVREAQIILVDDGSPDHCGAICDEYAEQDTRIVVLHQNNSGPSAARNNGIRHAEGRYLTFTDADDYILENTWELTISAMKKNHAQCAVFGRKFGSDEKGWEPVYVAEKTLTVSAEKAIEQIAGDNDACGGGYPWNKVWDTEVIRKANAGQVPLFPENLFAYEDKAWVIKTLQGLDRVVLMPELLYRYRFLESSMTNSQAAFHRRQFNAYEAYDYICDYLKTYGKRSAYRSAIDMYFCFSFIDCRNMFSWRAADPEWWDETTQHLYKLCRRIRPGDIKGFKKNLAWAVCLPISFVAYRTEKDPKRHESGPST